MSVCHRAPYPSRWVRPWCDDDGLYSKRPHYDLPSAVVRHRDALGSLQRWAEVESYPVTRRVAVVMYALTHGEEVCPLHWPPAACGVVAVDTRDPWRSDCRHAIG